MWVEKIDISLKKINQLFQSHGYNSVIVEDKIEVLLTIMEEEIRLEIVKPEDYPYSFLQVYLKERSSLSFNVAHMIIGDRLCLFEEASDRHDYKNYSNIALETLQRAQDLLETSKKKGNLSEYSNDFLDLWAQSHSIKIFSMLEDYNFSSILDLYFSKSNIDELNLIVKSSTISEVSVDSLARNLLLTLNKHKSKAFYLPVNKNTIEKPINTIDDLHNLLKNEDSFRSFIDFMRANHLSTELNLIILGIKNHELPVKSLVALYIPKLIFPKGKKIKEKTMRGILQLNKNKRITRWSVEDLSNTRILTRGGAGVENKDLRTVYVVGCGSLGSFLSKNLSDTGMFSKFILHDNQMLKSENIGRHLCGIDSIKLSKASAVANRINSNYPAIEIDTYTDNFNLELLGKRKNLINKKYDVLVIATGDENIEEQIINLLESEIIKIPTLIVWVEPFLIAGHALILNGKINQKTKRYIFDSLGNISIGVTRNSSKYSRAEAGCQSRFMPYSGFDMQLFSQGLVDFLIYKNGLNKTGNYHYCWIGNMKNARYNKRDVFPQWRSRDDRTVSVCRIDE